MSYYNDIRRLCTMAFCAGYFGIETYRETGMHEGNTCAWMKRFVGSIKGCDINATSIERSKELFPGLIEAHHADSIDFLRTVQTTGPVMLHLDSNWNLKARGFEEVETAFLRWPKHIAIASAIHVSGHSNFSGRNQDPISEKDFTRFKDRCSQILVPCYSTPESVAGYVILNSF